MYYSLINALTVRLTGESQSESCKMIMVLTHAFLLSAMNGVGSPGLLYISSLGSMKLETMECSDVSGEKSQKLQTTSVWYLCIDLWRVLQAISVLNHSSNGGFIQPPLPVSGKCPSLMICLVILSMATKCYLHTIYLYIYIY